MTASTLDASARIDLYVTEKAVARHEQLFQAWVESVAAPLRYVCIGSGASTTFVDKALGSPLPDFGNKGCPQRVTTSAFTGFSVAREQRGVWFRDESGDAEEDRVSIYSFSVPAPLSEVAYYAIRERFARRILRERNEQSVLLSRAGGPGTVENTGMLTELVVGKDNDYTAFARAFRTAAQLITSTDDPRYDLAWKLVHLLQLLERELLASVARSAVEHDVHRHLFDGMAVIVTKVFKQDVLQRSSPALLARWVRLAIYLKGRDNTVVSAVSRHIEEALKKSVLQIADSFWRYPSHPFVGAVDVGIDCCGVEAFAFLKGLDQCRERLGLPPVKNSEAHVTDLAEVWTEERYRPHLLLRDWRGLAYELKHANRLELAAAFSFRSVQAIQRSGISEEKVWYRSTVLPLLEKLSSKRATS